MLWVLLRYMWDVPLAAFGRAEVFQACLCVFYRVSPTRLAFWGVLQSSTLT